MTYQAKENGQLLWDKMYHETKCTNPCRRNVIQKVAYKELPKVSKRMMATELKTSPLLIETDLRITSKEEQEAQTSS